MTNYVHIIRKANYNYNEMNFLKKKKLWVESGSTKICFMCFTGTIPGETVEKKMSTGWNIISLRLIVNVLAY